MASSSLPFASWHQPLESRLQAAREPLGLSARALSKAVIASSFGLRFQGQGYFLTDARTHRGTSGAPVVMRVHGKAAEESGLPWKLLGIHSARIDAGTRDPDLDEALGLNCAWYADILMKLTES